jgi:hypothetical protein
MGKKNVRVGPCACDLFRNTSTSKALKEVEGNITLRSRKLLYTNWSWMALADDLAQFLAHALAKLIFWILLPEWLASSSDV